MQVEVFLDTEKANDQLWKEGLLTTCHDAGGERMLHGIQNFLCNRATQMRAGSELCEELEVENGTAQGSAISPSLFNVLLNDMLNRLGKEFGVSLLADDGAVWKQGRNLPFILSQIQSIRALEDVVTRANDSGFKISVDKTKYVIFGHKRKVATKYLQVSGKYLESQAVKFLECGWMRE